MISSVAFDLDDTLYDEIEYYKSGFSVVAAAMAKSAGSVSREKLFNALWEEFIAGNRRTTFNAAFERLGISYNEEVIQNMVQVLRQHSPSITLPADSETVLKTLQPDYKLALLTDGFLPAQQLKIQALGIEKYFQCIVYTEELGREYWKPSTAGFEKILRMLCVEGENCVYVGDNLKKDFIAPNKLGFKTIQIVRPNGIHTGDPPDESAKADYIIKSISDLPDLLREL